MTDARRREARRRILGLACAVVVAASLTVMAVDGLAWACVPQPRLITLQPRASGPAGSEVTVAALGFDPGRAEVRWNTSDGDLLASANGPDFSVPVTIPEAPDGLYHLVVLARSPGGEVGNTATASFQVTSRDATPPASTTPRARVGIEPAPSPGSSTSAGTVVLAGGAGAVVALGCFAALLALRRTRKSGAEPPSPGS